MIHVMFITRWEAGARAPGALLRLNTAAKLTAYQTEMYISIIIYFITPEPIQHWVPIFEIRAPYDAADYSPTFLQTSNLPNPVLSDERLKIKGNIIWNGSHAKFLGLDENTGGQPSNPDCNETQLLNDNLINTLNPQFVNPLVLNFHPITGSNILTALTFTIPAFTGTDKPDRPVIPAGNLVNTILRDYDGNTRTAAIVPGRFFTPCSFIFQYFRTAPLFKFIRAASKRSKTILKK